jgi:hypothetical protein
VTVRPVCALFSPVPLGRDTTGEARDTTGTTVPVLTVVRPLRRKYLKPRAFFQTYYEDYGYYGQSPFMRVRAHEAFPRSNRSPRSIILKRLLFSTPYREREILQSILRCVCVCSIIHSYPCQIVADRRITGRSADLREALQPQARALRTGALRTRIIPVRFNHCRNAINLIDETATMSDLCLDCTIAARNALFCDLSQPIETIGDTGRAPGAAPDLDLSHGLRMEGFDYIPNWLRPRPAGHLGAAARAPPRAPAQARRGGRTGIGPVSGKNFAVLADQGGVT